MLPKSAYIAALPAHPLPKAPCIPLSASLETIVSQPDPDGSRQCSILGTPSLSVQWEIDPERCLSCQLLSASALDTHTSPSFHPKKAHQGPWTSLPGPCCRLVCPPRQEWSACPSGLACGLGWTGTILCHVECLSPHDSPQGKAPIKGCLPGSFSQCRAHRVSITEWIPGSLV